MTVPIYHRKGAEKAIASYDYTDIAEGTGTVIYYLTKTAQDSVTSGALVSNTPYSQAVMTLTQQACPQNVYVLVHDEDFDLKFNLPKVIKGKCTINIAEGQREENDDAYRSYIHAYLEKVSNGTATSLVDASGGTLIGQAGGAGTYTYNVDAIEVDIPKTHFKKGDMLRLTVKQWATCHNTSGNNAQIFFGHDPKNRATTDMEAYTFGTAPSISQIHVPFVIDL